MGFVIEILVYEMGSQLSPCLTCHHFNVEIDVILVIRLNFTQDPCKILSDICLCTLYMEKPMPYSLI